MGAKEQLEARPRLKDGLTESIDRYSTIEPFASPNGEIKLQKGGKPPLKSSLSQNKSQTDDKKKPQSSSKRNKTQETKSSSKKNVVAKVNLKEMKYPVKREILL